MVAGKGGLEVLVEINNKEVGFGTPLRCAKDMHFYKPLFVM